MISPPKGFSVSLSTPAILRAALLATAPWPSARVRKTGLFGAILSRSHRSGRRGLPECLDPAASRHPLVRLGLVNARFDFGQKIFEARRPFQIEVHLAEPHAGEMIMRVYKTGHDRRAFQIDDLDAFDLILLRLGVRSYEDDLAVFGRDGLGLRFIVIGGVDIGVFEDDIGVGFGLLPFCPDCALSLNAPSARAAMIKMGTMNFMFPPVNRIIMWYGIAR